MSKKFNRKLINVEIKLGFLNIPSKGLELMPDDNASLKIVINDQLHQLRYNARYHRVFGLTKFYKKNKVKVGDEISFEKTGENYTLKFLEVSGKETPEEENEKLISLSGLSTQAKGDIVEDRIKELIILQGQGLLSVYRPVTDTQGVDLLVAKSGIFQPIFLQIKGRFNVQKKGYFLMDISKKTMTPHHSFFVIGAYFDPQKMEIADNLLLIPSEDVAKAPLVKSKVGERYRVANYLNSESKGRWSPFLTNKSNLAEKLLEKFDEIEKYVK